MAQNTTVAPWAEEVPGAPYPMTVDDLLALPRDADWQYEVVDGRLVRMPASGFDAARIALRLASALLTYVEDRGLGAVTGAGGTYNLTPAGAPTQTGLVPDVAFVAAARMPPPGSPDYIKAPRLAPDLGGGGRVAGDPFPACPAYPPCVSRQRRTASASGCEPGISSGRAQLAVAPGRLAGRRRLVRAATR